MRRDKDHPRIQIPTVQGLLDDTGVTQEYAYNIKKIDSDYLKHDRQSTVQ